MFYILHRDRIPFYISIFTLYSIQFIQVEMLEFQKYPGVMF